LLPIDVVIKAYLKSKVLIIFFHIPITFGYMLSAFIYVRTCVATTMPKNLNRRSIFLNAMVANRRYRRSEAL